MAGPTLTPIVVYESASPTVIAAFILIGLLALFGAFMLIRLAFEALKRRSRDGD
jgi:hypothetical protein